MVVERLVGSDEPAWRRAGLDVFWLAPRFFGYERLAGALRQHAGRGPDGVVPEADVPRDADWLRRVVLHQFRAGEVRALSDALKADMLAGWFEPLAVAHLIQADPHWLLTRAAALVTVNPGWEPVLREHFARLSEGARGALAAALKPRAEASLG
jgi:hypothetical protein